MQIEGYRDVPPNCNFVCICYCVGSLVQTAQLWNNNIDLAQLKLRNLGFVVNSSFDNCGACGLNFSLLTDVIYFVIYAFSSLMLLVWWQEEHPAYKKLSDEVLV